MLGLVEGQVYREYSDKDYGDIIRWKVAAVGRVCAVVTNQATNKDMVVDKESVDTFTRQCELMPEEGLTNAKG